VVFDLSRPPGPGAHTSWRENRDCSRIPVRAPRYPGPAATRRSHANPQIGVGTKVFVSNISLAPVCTRPATGAKAVEALRNARYGGGVIFARGGGPGGRGCFRALVLNGDEKGWTRDPHDHPSHRMGVCTTGFACAGGPDRVRYQRVLGLGPGTVGRKNFRGGVIRRSATAGRGPRRGVGGEGGARYGVHRGSSNAAAGGRRRRRGSGRQAMDQGPCRGVRARASVALDSGVGGGHGWDSWVGPASQGGWGRIRLSFFLWRRGAPGGVVQPSRPLRGRTGGVSPAGVSGWAGGVPPGLGSAGLSKVRGGAG